MENEENEIQSTSIQEQDEMENTENFEGESIESEGDSVSNNDNIQLVSSTDTFILNETQYNKIIQNMNMINNLGIIQVMFLFTIFIYLFIHFSIERRKF